MRLAYLMIWIAAKRLLRLLIISAFKHLLQHERDEHALGPKPKLLLKCCQSFVEADRKHDLQGDVRLFHGAGVSAAMMP